MRLAHTKKPRRSAFTLVELLVVIAIIVVLVSLTTAGVLKALDRGYQVRNQSEISQLDAAIGNFQTAFSVDYVPSRIRLREDLNYAPNLGNAYEADSYQYLLRLWPRLQGSNHNGKVGVDWNGDGQINQGGFVDLEGDQCLVFFLGGIPLQGGTPGTQGFSSNQADPSAGQFKPSIFTFDSSRLFDRTGQGFYSYSDTYMKTPPGTPGTWKGIPYAYFSSYKGGNGYFRYATANIPGNTGSDCSTLGLPNPCGGVSPYAEVLAGSPRFMKPTSYQIISAGADGVFGRGSLPTWTANNAATWSPGTAGTTPATWKLTNGQPSPQDMRAGYDDMSNFHGSLLGVPTQQ